MVIEFKSEELERIAKALEVLAKSAQMQIDNMIAYEANKNDSNMFDAIKMPEGAKDIDEEPIGEEQVDMIGFDEQPEEPKPKRKKEKAIDEAEKIMTSDAAPWEENVKPKKRTSVKSKKGFGNEVEIAVEDDDDFETVVKANRKKPNQDQLEALANMLDEEDETLYVPEAPVEEPVEEPKPKKKSAKKTAKKEVEDDEILEDW